MRALRGLVAGLPEESSGALSGALSRELSGELSSGELSGGLAGQLSGLKFWPSALHLCWQMSRRQLFGLLKLSGLKLSGLKLSGLKLSGLKVSESGLLRGLTGLLLVASGSAAFAEIEIREVPLRWQQAAISDGGQLYLELCAACHGKSGNGDGPAAAALKKPTPDLTVLAANNNGVFPREAVEDAITGKTSTPSHGTLDMPIWGAAFEGVRPDWKPFRREALARQRIHNLTEYISDIQTR